VFFLMLSCNIFFSCIQKNISSQDASRELQVRFDSTYHFIVNNMLMSHESLDSFLLLCDELTSVSPSLLEPRQIRLWNNSYALAASYYMNNNEPKKALILLQRGIAIADSLGDNACLTRAANLLALIYSNWKLDEEANMLFDKMIAVADKKDVLTMGNTYLAKAMHMAYSMKYDSAAYYVSLIDSLGIKKEDMLPGSYKSVDYSIRLLKGWYLTENPDSLFRAIDILQGLYDEYAIHKEQAVSFEAVCFRLGRAYELAGDKKKAMHYYNEAKELIMASQPVSYQFEVAEPLMNALLHHHEMSNAMDFLPVWKKVSEQYYDNQLRGMLAYYSVKLDVAAKEKEIIKAEELLFKRRIEVIGLCLLVVILFVLIIWGVIYWRNKKRQLRTLFEALMRRYLEWREINHYLACEYITQIHLLDVSKPTHEYGEDNLQMPPTDSGDDFYRNLYYRVLVVMEKERPFLNPDLTISLLAKMAITNRTHLSAAINRMTGSNFSVWLAEYRVNYVIYLMNDTGTNNMDVLYEQAGFSSRTTFYRQFKQITGLTPKQFLKRKGL
uniref:helix-turn-helix domain-containing protein n=1 Tax=Phocaeicola coprophilus TaxID=387090 RepID=UPI003AB55D6F